MKYGRYIPNNKGRFDKVLGVQLASDNQYAERIDQVNWEECAYYGN
jgi:hypothetical protein